LPQNAPKKLRYAAVLCALVDILRAAMGEQDFSRRCGGEIVRTEYGGFRGENLSDAIDFQAG